MPEVGDQHNNARNGANPFEETKPHISEYTAQEIATLSSRLEKQLGPEYISSRPGAAGQKVHYLAADKCINLANEVFGFNGWSSAIKQIQIDFVDESQSTGKVSLGLSVIVRVTLRDGTYHEDIGYGHIENAKGKAAAFEKAKKEGTTDALKRALRNFGNILGNCVYDKEYVAKVTKIKVAPSKWDPENLHRHHDFVPVKKEELEHSIARPSDHDNIGIEAHVPAAVANIVRRDHSYGEDEFGGNDFDEIDFNAANDDEPDGVVLDAVVKPDQFHQKTNHAQARPPPNRFRQQGGGPGHTPQTPSRPPSLTGLPNAGPQMHTTTNKTVNPLSGASSEHNHPGPTRPQSLATTSIPAPHSNPISGSNFSNDSTLLTSSSDTLPIDAPVGFFNAKAAESVQKGAFKICEVPTFNVHGESPSIRKTAGVDHTRSKPVRSEVISAATQDAGTPMIVNPIGGNFVNPQVDKTRRVGMPNGGGSPLSNRSTYKPPQMKRPAEPGRLALADVTAGAANASIEPTGDGKRQRTGEMGGVQGMVS